MTWVTGPLCGMDLETDSPQPGDAHLITAAVAVRGGPAEAFTRTWLARPRRPIDPSATRIHGITTEHAAEHGRPITGVLREVVGAMQVAWHAGVPVCGKNISYDLTVLDRECARHGLPPLDIAGPVLDAQIIDGAVDRFRKGSRKLDALCEHYGVALTSAAPGETSGAGAHDALADVLGTLRVIWRMGMTRQIPSYSDPKRRQLRDVTLPELHLMQVEWAKTRAASLQAYFDRTGKTETVDGSWPLRRQQVAA